MNVQSKVEIASDGPIAEADRFHTKRALELARLGTGLVSPNPLVGCVVG
jgi:pyrimidine deaminase RibD-like protein